MYALPFCFIWFFYDDDVYFRRYPVTYNRFVVDDGLVQFEICCVIDICFIKIVFEKCFCYVLESVFKFVFILELYRNAVFLFLKIILCILFLFFQLQMFFYYVLFIFIIMVL